MRQVKDPTPLAASPLAEIGGRVAPLRAAKPSPVAS